VMPHFLGDRAVTTKGPAVISWPWIDHVALNLDGRHL
jgi:hypothetical protein